MRFEVEKPCKLVIKNFSSNDKGIIEKIRMFVTVIWVL